MPAVLSLQLHGHGLSGLTGGFSSEPLRTRAYKASPTFGLVYLFDGPRARS